jgi:chromosome segregation ATPase
MMRIDRVVAVLALGITLAGAGVVLDLTGGARAASPHQIRSRRAASPAEQTAVRSLAESARSLSAAIRRAKDETSKVLVPAFASLASSQAGLASERAQLAQEQQQINGEVAQLAAESSALQREAAALRNTARTSAGHPRGGQPGDN